MSTHNARPFSKREKKFFKVVFGVGTILIFAPLWWRSRNAVPDVQIPNPQMPTPNAFDYFVSAGKAVVRSQKIGYAIAIYPSGYKSTNFISGSPPGLPLPPSIPASQVGEPLDRNYSLKEKEQLLKPQAAALKSLRLGLRCDYVHPPVRSFAHQLPYLSQWRELARILVLESQVYAAKGNRREALNSALDCIQFGRSIPRGAPLIVTQAGYGIQFMGRKQLLALFSQLNASDSQYATEKLENILQQHVSFAETLQEEKWSTQGSLMELFKDGRWRQMFDPAVCSFGAEEPQTKHDRPVSWSRRYTITPSQLYRGYTAAMEASISASKLSYLKAVKTIDPDYEPILNFLVADTPRAFFEYSQNDSKNVILLAMLALHAYKFEHGAYPNSLNELTSRYLKKVPLDPFADRKPLQYKRVGSEYSLYSIGPDCIDNHGRPIDTGVPIKESPLDLRRYRVDQDSKGDIVAGINIG